MTAFRQSARVREALRVHLGRHYATQNRIVLLTENGSLLILWRATSYEGGGITITRKSITPTERDWEPALVEAHILSRTAA